MAGYRDIASIGRGGFAEVWSCERGSDGLTLAKKVLFATATPEKVERFQQEVRILAKLDHPNIIKVLESQLSVAPYWYVMPRYRASLKDELNQTIGNLQRIKKVFGAILDGVEFAHREGVIHRDLKPANVLLNSEDEVVVTDFGIGRIMDAEGDRNTLTGQGMGSRYYASPEQTDDAKSVDARSDIFNLGRMLYELFTERLNNSVQHLNRLPPNIAPIVDRCTQRLPADRFQSVTELKDAWRSAFEVTSLDSGIGEAKRLVNELVATPSLQAKADRLLHLLAENKSDNDLIRDALTQAPPGSISLMLGRDPSRLRGLISQFVDHVTSQSWGASYLDKLGARCGNLFLAVKDPAIRADLAYCTLMLGVKGKRYGVLETLAQILQTVRDADDVAALQERLKTLPSNVKAEAGRWMELEELDPRIASLFG